MISVTSGFLVCITLGTVTFIWEVKKHRVKIRLREKYYKMRFVYVEHL